MGLSLSGGGASAGFHLGALRYLYDVVGITPSVITGTSAGSVLAAVLAQADDHDGQRQALADLERVYEGLRSSAEMLVELDWFTELQKLVPALQRVGRTRTSHLESQAVRLPGLGLRPGAGRRELPVEEAPDSRVRLPRWDPTPVRDTLSAVWSIGRAHPDFDELLRGGLGEQSMFRPGPVFDELLGPAMLHPARLASSATHLRISVVSLESGDLRYVTGEGVVVDRDDCPVAGHPVVPLVDAVRASCAIPVI